MHIVDRRYHYTFDRTTKLVDDLTPNRVGIY